MNHKILSLKKTLPEQLNESKKENNCPINNDAVKAYFQNAHVENSTLLGMMIHDYNLPNEAIEYRFEREKEIINEWTSNFDKSARVLDIGCGSGVWTEFFSKKHGHVVALEQSDVMLTAAKERLKDIKNIEIIKGDALRDLPDNYFDIIFLGGLCMYQNDNDVLKILASLKRRLATNGEIILRESTAHKNLFKEKNGYQAIYRSPSSYYRLFNKSGFIIENTKRNYSYTSLAITKQIINFQREHLPFFSKYPRKTEPFVWWVLRYSEPFSFWALPRILNRLNIFWPDTQNHFFKLSLSS
ncbi:hypothetical protein BFP97_01525 [Roseivirga sp. 4D4]|uniref:class I SAM-dependent methyltransferase n=1 Tax=Roseivirga sp. 4D4 TaxID=1889784 RepID=UPI000852AFE9|nr:class I SAM-dependent methyltransferase [Roseivirga sp. 4D4]OEK00271.1 hypothetical protein BFP97_01525 [Roseivirga sp. 4D4]